MYSVLPFRPYESQVAADLPANVASKLGETFQDGTKKWRMVKAASPITTAGAKIVEWSDRSAYTVMVHSTPANRTAGVIHTSSGDIATGDYLLVQITGRCTVLGGASVAAGNYLKPHATDGTVDDGGAQTAQDITVDFAVAVTAASAATKSLADIIGELN